MPHRRYNGLLTTWKGSLCNDIMNCIGSDSSI